MGIKELLKELRDQNNKTVIEIFQQLMRLVGTFKRQNSEIEDEIYRLEQGLRWGFPDRAMETRDEILREVGYVIHGLELQKEEKDMKIRKQEQRLMSELKSRFKKTEMEILRQAEILIHENRRGLAVTIYCIKGKEIITEERLCERYRDYLDEIYEKNKVNGTPIYPTRDFEAINPAAFQRGFKKWKDAEGWAVMEPDDDRLFL